MISTDCSILSRISYINQVSKISVQKGHVWELNCTAWDQINFRPIHHWKDISISFPLNFTNLNLELSKVSYDQLNADCSVLSRISYINQVSRISVQKGHLWKLNCTAWDRINFRSIHHWKYISVSLPMNFTNINLELCTVSYDQLSADCSVLSRISYINQVSGVK